MVFVNMFHKNHVEHHIHIISNYISFLLLYLQNTQKQFNRLQIKTSINIVYRIAGNVAIYVL